MASWYDHLRKILILGERVSTLVAGAFCEWSFANGVATLDVGKPTSVDTATTANATPTTLRFDATMVGSVDIYAWSVVGISEDGPVSCVIREGSFAMCDTELVAGTLGETDVLRHYFTTVNIGLPTLNAADIEFAITGQAARTIKWTLQVWRRSVEY